jgi:zinc protease
METLYGPEHPYGRRLKGTIDTLTSVKRADLMEYHRRLMVPSALQLAVVGDVSDSAVVSGAARVFSGWHSHAPTEEPVPSPGVSARASRCRPMAGKAQADICYGFSTIRRLDPRYYAYWMMNTVLGQFGLGGRLAENIRERQGMAYYAYSTLEATVGEGPLVVHAGVDPRNVARAIAAIDAEVGALGQDGPTPDELEESRESLIGSVPRMLENNESIAEFLQHAEQFDLGLDYDRRLPALLRAVTMADVRAAARDVLAPDRAVVAVAGPPE